MCCVEADEESLVYAELLSVESLSILTKESKGEE
jgi:hypothetical protein